MRIPTLAALGIVLAAAFTPASSANAQGIGLSAASTPLPTQRPGTSIGADANQIADFLRGEGYAVQVSTDDQGDPLITTRSQGARVSIYFYGCEQGRNCSSISFDSAFRPNNKTGDENLHAWGRSKRYAYAVRRADQNIALRMDILMFSGISVEHFRETVSLWERQLGSFLRHIEF
jgi:hypothetical protein